MFIIIHVMCISLIHKQFKPIIERNEFILYNEELHYTSVNDKYFPKYVPKIFKHIKGLKDIQRYVYSIESTVDRTYVGFDSPKHLKKCYYKFTYMKTLIHVIICNSKSNQKPIHINIHLLISSSNHLCCFNLFFFTNLNLPNSMK